MSRATKIGLLAAAVVCLPSASVAATRVADVRVVGPLAGQPYGGPVGVAAADQVSGPLGDESFFTRVLSLGSRGEEISAAARSARPQQLTVDRTTLGGVGPLLVWSHCPGGVDRGVPYCVLRRISGRQSQPTTFDGTPEMNADRLPAADAGNIAFVRERPGGRDDELRWLPQGAQTSIPLHSGPQGMAEDEAAINGLALRGTTAAYVWEWRPRRGETRYTLQTQRVGQRPRTLVSIPAAEGRILGPVWRGTNLWFAVRGTNASSLYRYSTTSRRYARTTAPRSIAAIGFDNTALYWTRGATQTPAGELACAPTCRVEQTPLSTLRLEMTAKYRRGPSF